MKKSTAISLFVIVFFIIIASCSKKSTNALSTQSELISKEKIDQFMIKYMNKNQTTFDWLAAPDDMLYSAMMHTDSVLTIVYTANPEIKKASYKKDKTLTDVFLVKRDSIINDILEKERMYRNMPELQKSDLLPPYTLWNKLPIIKMKVTKRSIITDLRKDRFVTALGCNYIAAFE